MDISMRMRNIKVEVIVLPLVKNTSTHKIKSMMGFLKDYANTELVEQEKNAWEMHLQEKYGLPVSFTRIRFCKNN